MPARIRYDVVIVDRSPLARNMYQMLFAGQDRYQLNFSDEFESLFKKSARLKPDLLVVNSNAIERNAELKFPCPTVLVVSPDRTDLKESFPSVKQHFLLEKPFYPYELLSVASRMIQDKREAPKRGRPPGRRVEG